MLTDLTVRRDGSLYGSAIWRFQLHPAAEHKELQQLPADEKESEPNKGPEAHELPYHRFSHRDALLLSMLAGVDDSGDAVFVSQVLP